MRPDDEDIALLISAYQFQLLSSFPGTAGQPVLDLVTGGLVLHHLDPLFSDSQLAWTSGPGATSNVTSLIGPGIVATGVVPELDLSANKATGVVKADLNVDSGLSSARVLVQSVNNTAATVFASAPGNGGSALLSATMSLDGSQGIAALTGGSRVEAIVNGTLVLDSDPEIAYAPSVSSSGVPPFFGGAGFVAVGQYERVGRRVLGNMFITAGAAVTAGTGNYIVAFPVPPRVPLAGSALVVGTGYLFDNSAGSLWTIVVVDTGLMYFQAAAGAYFFSLAQPFTLAAADQIVINWNYPYA